MGCICSICSSAFKCFNGLCECLVACVTCRCVHCAVSTMKYLLFCINTFFLLIGCIMVGLGAYLQQSGFLVDTYGEAVNDAAVAFIVLGVMTILISMLGCIGSRDMNRRSLTIYMVVTFILLCCELGFAIDVIETTKAAHVYNICLKANQTFTPTDPANGKTYDCATFASNTFRLGSYMVWQFLWNEGQLHYYKTQESPAAVGTGRQKKAFELVAGLQEQGRCCGFGPPVEKRRTPGKLALSNQCHPDPTKFDINGNEIRHQLCYGYDPDPDRFEDCPCNYDEDGSYAAKFDDGEEGKGCDNPQRSCQYGKVKTKDNKYEPRDGFDENKQGLYCAWSATESGAVNKCLTPDLNAVEQRDQYYDFPVGGCADNCVPWGCGQVMYEHIETRLLAMGTGLIIVVLLNFIGFALSICLVCAHRAGVGKGVVRNGKGTEMV